MYKILFLNIYKDYGSTGSLISAIRKSIDSTEFKTYQIYGRRRNGDSSGQNDFCVANDLYGKFQHLIGKLSGNPYGHCATSTRKVIRKIKTIKPDLISIHCCNGYFVNLYRLFAFIGKLGIPITITHHAEFYYTGNCPHALACNGWRGQECRHCPRFRSASDSWLFNRTHDNYKKMLKAISSIGNLTSISVSPWANERVSDSPIFQMAEKTVILNGVSTTIFRPSQPMQLNAKAGGRKIGLVLPSLKEPLKGGQYLEKLASDNPKDDFYIMGISDQNKCVAGNVHFLGKTSDKKMLASFFSSIDATLLLSAGETFSLVCAESLCCGTPVIGFKCGGPESVFLQDAEFVKYGDFAGLNALICSIKAITPSMRKEISERARMKFDINRMSTEYKSLFANLLEGHH